MRQLASQQRGQTDVTGLPLCRCCGKLLNIGCETEPLACTCKVAQLIFGVQRPCPASMACTRHTSSMGALEI